MEEDKKTKRLLIIDGNALVHRAFHALPPLKTRKGEIVNAIYGFFLVLFKAIDELCPEYLVATFDSKGPTFRHKQFKEYKAQRKRAPDELYEQLDKVKKVLIAFNIPIFEKQGFEADDLIATIACSSTKDNSMIEAIIVSGDMDNLQLVNDKIKVYTMRKGVRDTVLYDDEKVKEKYNGLSPSQLVDFRGLRGDPSDNIPGVAGIGEKTAIDLLKEFRTLDNLYQVIEKNKTGFSKIKPSVLEKLRNSKDLAFLSKKLAQMDSHSPIDFDLVKARFNDFDVSKAKEALGEFEFYSLIAKLDSLGKEKVAKPKELKTIKPLVSKKFEQVSTNQGFLFSAKTYQDENILEEIERFEKEEIFSSRIAQVERDLIPIIERMEKNGVKVDLSKLKSLSLSLEKDLSQLTKKIYQSAHRKFNINSSQQLSEVLFNKLKVNPLGMKKTPKGVVSIGAAELLKIQNQHPVIKLILEYRELFKLKTGFVDSLSSIVNPKDGRIHPHFHQLGTETGRMSCSSPNLQNIPIKGAMGKKIRECFIAEEYSTLVSADYTQVELRIVAIVANDETMLSAFRNQEDIHTATAGEIFNVEKEKVDKEMRDMAKTLNFGVLYGMGHVSFAERVGIGRGKAKEFIKKYFEEFNGVNNYVKVAKQKAKEVGFVETMFGRKRFLTEIGSFDPRMRAQAERMAVNMPIQGASADIIKMAMVILGKKKILDKDCKLILQIHDELLFEIKNEKSQEKQRQIKDAMENVVQLAIPLEVKVREAKSWGGIV